MTSVSTYFPEVKCAGCPAMVVEAEDHRGELVRVERARGRRGSLGLTGSLFGGRPLAAPNQARTFWKYHHCDTVIDQARRAFSAGSFDRKVRP